MHTYIHPIKVLFEQYSDAANAAGAKAYLLNQFEHFGIVTPVRRKLCKDYMKAHPLFSLKELENIVTALWQLPEREYQYFAVELFAHHKKLWKASSIKLMEYCIVHKSWWDSVDHIASELTSPYFTLFPEQIITITSKWNRDDNIWLQRSSIMFQKAYKNKTDTALLSKYILHCKDSKEFFVRKAIGWALREYSKTNPKWVKQFVQQNKLHPLSEREALKRINRE